MAGEFPNPSPRQHLILRISYKLLVIMRFENANIWVVLAASSAVNRESFEFYFIFKFPILQRLQEPFIIKSNLSEFRYNMGYFTLN